MVGKSVCRSPLAFIGGRLKQNTTHRAYLIDQVVALDLPARKVSRQLYDAAMHATGEPLCLAAAEKIAAASSKGDTAFILTGFPIPPKNVGETDGPPGATVLAKTLQAAGLKPLMVTDYSCLDIVKAAAGTDTPVLSYPTEEKQASLEAEKLLSKFNPSVLIAIERPGWNQKHQYHNMRGLNISNLVGKTDYLFEQGHSRGIATIAVGDGGNELGCGKIIESVCRHVPYGAKCQCPCGGGIAAATPADVLVIGGISNWGGYGIAACLSLMKGLEYKHGRDNELRLLNQVVGAGAIDSITLENKPLVDGLPALLNGLVAELLWTIVNM